MTGSRGPLPKPNALKALEGNPGRRPLNLADGVNPAVAVPPMPKHLGPEARKEWKRITPLLEELGLISAIDRAALAIYCQTYGRLCDYETALAGMINLKVSAGMPYADAVYEASHAVTPSGYAQQSVIVQLISRQRAELHRALAHFGLSPAARARVQPSNYVLQPELPGVEPSPAMAAPAGFAQFVAPPPRFQ